MHVCLSVAFQSVSSHSLKHAYEYLTSNERACQVPLIDAFIFEKFKFEPNLNFEKALLLREFTPLI